MTKWMHRCCERCWFDRTNPGIGRPHGENEDGSYRQPAQTIGSEPSACCVCGGMTITGIFIRADPDVLLCGGNHDDPAAWSSVDTRPAGNLT